jgi:hypothetical protein
MRVHDPVVVVRSAALVAMVSASIVFGCSASSSPTGVELPPADAIQAEFQAYVDAANHCEAASDCVGLTPGCPLPCMVAVRVDRNTDVLAKAQQLRARLPWGCEATCPAPGPAMCIRNRCEVNEPGAPSANPSIPMPPSEGGTAPSRSASFNSSPCRGNPKSRRAFGRIRAPS